MTFLCCGLTRLGTGDPFHVSFFTLYDLEGHSNSSPSTLLFCSLNVNNDKTSSSVSVLCVKMELKMELCMAQGCQIITPPFCDQ